MATSSRCCCSSSMIVYTYPMFLLPMVLLPPLTITLSFCVCSPRDTFQLQPLISDIITFERSLSVETAKTIMHDKAIEHRKSIIYQTAHVSLANGLQLHQDFMDFYHKQRDLKASFASTPLHSCTLSKNPERMRKYLQNQEYEPNVTDINGYTALHFAALIGATEVARILLEFGADANIAAKDGNTPMHKAAQGGHIEVTEILAAAKGDPTRKNQKGELPIDISGWRKHTKVTAFLKKLDR